MISDKTNQKHKETEGNCLNEIFINKTVKSFQWGPSRWRCESFISLRLSRRKAACKWIEIVS